MLKVYYRGDLMSKFGERLKELRLDSKLSQDKLSEQTGISQGAISSYEVGKAKATEDVIVVFCEYFLVSADFMLGLKDE